MKNKKELERIVRGVSNHRRIEILTLLSKSPDLSVIAISERLNVNFKTIAEHTRRLYLTGMIEKNIKGAQVQHKLTPRGRCTLKFLRTLE